MTPAHKALAKKFAEYVSDDLPPEIRAPDSIELGNALLEAHVENERLRAALRPFAEEVTVKSPGKYSISSDRKRSPMTDLLRARQVYDATA